MINNSSAKTLKGVKNNDASKFNEEDKAHKLDKDKTKVYSSSLYSFNRGFKNVRYSSYTSKFANDNRLRDDYKMARGSYTRKTTRGVSKREYDTSYNTRRKFQDTNKDFSPAEDTRISKTLRRMVREDDPDAFSALCSQLQESITVVENERYIRKAMEFICESILDMLHSGPSYETKYMAAKCLSHLAIALEGDAKRFFDWIFTKYYEERNLEVRVLLMKALYYMLQLDKEHLLRDFAALLIGQIQNILENAEVSELVLTTGKIFRLLIDEYIEVFSEFFKDTVDILVGWHIDIEQSQYVLREMAACLQSLAPYWITDLGFTVSLLGQLLEDMERYANDYKQICLDYAKLRESASENEASSLKLDSLRCLAKTMAFMKVFNSITKTVGQYLTPTSSANIVTWNFLVDSLSKVVRTVLLCLEIENIDEELIITGNECAWLLISLMQCKLNPGHDTLCKLIHLQLQMAPTFNNYTLASLLQLISKIVKEGSANLPEDLIGKLIGPGSYILKLRFSTNLEIHKGVVSVYQSLLNLKNIPLLQEAYKYILGDMERAYMVLDPSLKPFCTENPHSADPEYCPKVAQAVLLFHLNALSDLANAGGSIIGMWVLQPCILELLAVKLQPVKANLNPSVRYAILYLLYSHCSRYSNFISSSELVTSVQGRTNVCDLLRIIGSDITPTTSPTSGHLTIILNLLSELLKADFDRECTMLSLKWCGVLINHAQMYLSSLLITKEFLKLMKTMIKYGFKSTDRSANEILLNDLLVFLYNPNNWDSKPDLLREIAELCLIHLNATDPTIKQKSTEIIIRLPWSSVITVIRNVSQKFDGSFNRILSTFRTHMNRDTNSEIQSQHFKLFLSYVLEDVQYEEADKLFVDSFYNCWNSAESKSDFENIVPYFESALLFWETWECVQYCVKNKLRTTLGKPQDTFMAIEGALKNLARETMRKHADSEDTYTLRRVRLLLEFVEQLEKSMYNASDGTAAALPAPSKPVRTFFHTNRSTCAEWLARIRLIIVMVSLQAGLSSTAIRHGFCLLQDMVQAGNTKSCEFTNAIMYVSWALYSLNESKAIEGLYTWCLETLDLPLPFLKALSDQAANKYESALETYLNLVDEVDSESLSIKTSELSLHSNSSSQDPMYDSLRSFIADQITECYLDLNDWTQLKEWKKKEADFLSTINGSCVQRYSHVTVKEAEMFCEIDQGNFTSVSTLMDWNTASNTNHNGVKSGWNTRQMLNHTQQSVMEKFIVVQVDKEVSEQHLNSMTDFFASIKSFLWEDLRNLPSPLVEDYATLLFVVSSYFSDAKTFLNNFTMEITGADVGSKRLGNALWWTKIIEKYRKNILNIDKRVILSELCLRLTKSARKEGNMHLASRQLLNHFEKVFSSLISIKNTDNGCKPYNILLEAITNQSTAATTAIWSVDNTDALLELSKLAHRYNNEELAIEICAMTALGITHAGGNGDPFIRDKTSNLLLKLAKWLSTELVCSDSALPFASYPTIQKLLALLRHNINPTNSGSSFEIMSYDFTNSVIPEKDSTVGDLLRISVVQSPTLAKVWNRFGNWCYKWGRTVVDKQNNLLTAADKVVIDGFIPSEVINKEDVYSILTRIKPAVDEEDIEADNVNTTELIEWQLRSTGQFSDDQMSGLLDIWRSTHARIYAYYHLAAQAYFKYLQLSDFNTNGAETVTATLRLLRLIVKYSLELQSVLEVELAYTPTTPWKCIIPQLFSRLSHPEPYVRRRISELLSRLAEDAPHLITFPAVVGSDSGATGTINNMPTSKLFKSVLTENEVDPGMIQDEDEADDEDDDEVSQDDQGRILENCYQGMVDALAKQVPETISQVQLLVSELRRITLLWDELWLGALTQHYSDMARRINQLETEVNRIDANRHLSEAEKDTFVLEKYLVLLRPLLFILEQLQAITSVKAETPHEQWFQKTYGDHISNTISSLQNPKDPRKPQDAWKIIKLLQCQFQRRASKRSSYSLKMTDISPALASLKNTSIAMPGVEQYITIASVHNPINVLPTKTKPKKLVFRGSDGKMYTYLFKGLEDLHLDERIMQFLSIANTMLKDSGYQARHYSVIPLGPRSGLISWVDHVTPIFAVYKRWQQREAVVNNQNSVMRPSELFYAKLTPLLKEHGVSNLDNRKEWPLSVLVQVLNALMKETPDNLLAKELWCQSVNTGVWWKIVKLYSTSLAVMSVIGYIIGLGDRHLDNVLVHLSTGEVVHIDYNVCFEKGKTLRVPEKVPFRMTQNLRAALGVTGIEGIFRLTCEQVMEVLKSGKETLLTLLEAFVYDPLIDWTPGIETGYTGAVYGGGRAVALKNKQSRKQLELEVTSSMFSIRIAEIKSDWFENKNKMIAAVAELYSNIETWIKSEETLGKILDGLMNGSQQLEVLKAAAAHPQHPLYTLHSRYQSQKDASEAMIKAQIGLKQKLEECDTQLAQYKMLFYHLRGEKLSQWMNDLNNRKDQDSQLFDIITEFLKSTGQNQLVSQCLQTETELNENIKEQLPLVISCLDLLKKYSMVSTLYPTSSSLKHRCTSYHRWIHTMLEFPSPSMCDKVISEFNHLYSVSIGNENVVQQATKFSESLHQRVIEAEYALKSRLEKLDGLTKENENDIVQMEQAIEKYAENTTLTLQCAVISELCQLNKRFLKMETAALGAGNCLMVLTTLDGEWFLDDMCLMTEVSIKLASYILSPALLEENPSMHLVTKCLDLLHGIYKRLQELNVNFSTIILPETLKKLLVEDETVLDVISKLNLIVTSCSLPLNELIKELQTHLRYMIMGMPSPHASCVAVAAELRCKFNALVNERSNSLNGSMTEGQMLLMGFNLLFSNIFKSTAELFSLLPALAMTNATWNSVDLIKDTRSLIGPIFSKESQILLQDLFLVKYINTMQEFFCKCQMTAAAYQGGLSMPTVYHSEEQLSKLVKKFTADFLSQQLLGLFSYTFATTIGLFLQHIGFNIIAEVEQRDIGAESKVPMEELCLKAIDQLRQQEAISSSTFSHASSILNNLPTAWKRLAINKRLKLEIQAQEMIIQNLKLQYTTHRWLHEDSLSGKNLPTPLIDRSEFMMELKLALTDLITSQMKITELKEQQESLIGSAKTRLKWAAGSNPALTEVMNSFEEKIRTDGENFARNNQLAATIINMSTCVLHYESLRVQTPEAILSDTNFVQLVNNYKEACNMVMGLATASFTPEEEHLVQLLPPVKPVDSVWIEEADNLMSETIKKLGNELEPLKSAVASARDEVKSSALLVRTCLSEHHKILMDVRSLLKSMMKFEDNDGIAGIPDYLARHKAYCEQLNSITKELTSVDLIDTKGHGFLKQLQIIQQQTNYVYDELQKFSVERVPQKAKRPPLLRQESIRLSPKKKLPHDPRTGKVLQEKNEYAVNVWRRVRMKLEGRDSDHGDGRKLSVHEQVDKIIKDATNVENLALLYEGWTPWV